MYKPFYDLFPDIAERESRTAHLLKGGKPGDIPAGDYLFLELYCVDPACDCERVMLSVVEKRAGIVATINYGFNPAKYRHLIGERNPFLDPINPQSKYSEKILALFKELVLDKEYDERLRRHYRMVKSAVGSPGDSSGRTVSGARPRRRQWANQVRKRHKTAGRGKWRR